VETKKVTIQKKRGPQVDYAEIEIPTDEAMIEVAQRLHSAGTACRIELDGYQAIYIPPRSILVGPSSNPLVEGEASGPWQESETFVGARCGFGKGKWFAIFDWLTEESGPVKTSTTEGVLPGRPIVMQESLLNWRPKEPPVRGTLVESEAGDLESQLASTDLHEGARIRVQADRYERDPLARAACIQYYGPTCVICGFNFAATYGDAAAGFIHVHHLRPLSAEGRDHAVDPITDLRPVCPNCHSFVHLRIPPVSIDEAIGVVKGVLALRADNSDRD
jgi:HNH endonuclease